MATYLSKDGTYLINDLDRGRKRFSYNTYFTLDNWWYDYKLKNGCGPSFSEMQQMCARRSIGGIAGTTFPDSSMRSIYNRLCDNPDPIIRKCLGSSGKCAPLSDYKDERIFYMSAEADKAVKKYIKEALAEKRKQKPMRPI